MPTDQEVNELLAESLSAVEVADAGLTKAAEALAQHAAKEAEWQAKIPHAVAELVRCERIDPQTAKIAAEKLKDPSALMDVLIKCADTTVTVRPKVMGHPAPGHASSQKVAGQGSTATAPHGSMSALPNAVTDARVPVGESPADKAFARTYLGRDIN